MSDSNGCGGRLGRRCTRCAYFDAHRLADETLELGSMSRRCPELEFGVARRPQLQQSIVAAIVQLEARHRLRVAAIEALGEPQHGRQTSNATAALLLEVAVPVVAALGRRLPMVAGDQRDVFHFLGIEPAQIPVLD